MTKDTKKHKGLLEDVKSKVEIIILNFLIFSVSPCLRGEDWLLNVTITQ